jgi:hypothetical protein
MRGQIIVLTKIKPVQLQKQVQWTCMNTNIELDNNVLQLFLSQYDGRFVGDKLVLSSGYSCCFQ